MLKLKNFREDNDYTQEDIAKILDGAPKNEFKAKKSKKKEKNIIEM